ncbi:MAG TPA: hypothetical protein VF115_00740 [Acidimicrobiia bacterium]
MTEQWQELILRAGHQASQDFDAWVLRLGTAGFTLVLGVAAIVKTEDFSLLVGSGSMFAASLVAGLLSLRLSADGHRVLSESENKRVGDLWQFQWVTVLNWVAFVTLSAAFILLAMFLKYDAMPNTGGV